MIKLSLLFGLLMTVSNFNSNVVATKPATSYTAPVMTKEEIQFTELVNKERAERGLQQLIVDPTLIKVARTHSGEMSNKHYFSHNSPTPGIKTALDRYLTEVKQRPTWALVGENLFYCSIVDVDRGHYALMNSEGHRANILEPRYERIGVGICTDSEGEFYVTQMFLAKTD